MHWDSKRSTTSTNRSGITLIETVISMTIMSVLFLGLSGAVVIGSKAIPTAADTGVNDQVIIDALNQFRDEFRQAANIQYRSTASGVQFVLTLKASGVTGAPSVVTYRYQNLSETLGRKVDSGSIQELATGLSTFQSSILLDGSTIRAIVIRFDATNSLQGSFEAHITLPNKPESL